MTVNWEEPEDDGGSPISGFWLERKETTGKRWTRVTRDPIRPMGMGESFVVSGLIEGSQYQFRVTAINAAGPGLTSPPTDPVFAREAISKTSTLTSDIFMFQMYRSRQDFPVMSSNSSTLSSDPQGFRLDQVHSGPGMDPSSEGWRLQDHGLLG